MFPDVRRFLAFACGGFAACTLLLYWVRSGAEVSWMRPVWGDVIRLAPPAPRRTLPDALLLPDKNSSDPNQEQLPPVLEAMRAWRRRWWGNVSDSSAALRDARRNFTVQMLTYNRMDILPKVLQHYAQSPLVDRIILQWNDVRTPPPPELTAGNLSAAAYRGKLYIEPQRENKLTNRMRLSVHARTDCVLIIDDDLIVSLDDLHFAFDVWRREPWHLIGFHPRAHEYDAGSDTYSYVSSTLRNGSYSLILTGLVLIHRLYYNMFSQVIPPTVYRLIDTLTNCEDIVINVFVTLLLDGDAAGRLVAGKFHGLKSTGHSGLWHRPKHFHVRNYCINKLLHEYGRGALRYTKVVYRAAGRRRGKGPTDQRNG